ncbi:TonB-dependent receptor [Sphingomonas alba]|uniref:TonB-dependent receptor n=1 Tax=Sphingomonas alba TaxID=2908208 RepID=A0ABT0RPG9_9SPHN|nr:TonB-dependent receptor [Sphingomonas alba]MCL6684490.1 TonB-dependent receptor [Sphingomonas alba]
MATQPPAISPKSWLSTRGRWTAAFAWSLVAVSVLAWPQPAIAAYSIVIPAGTLAQSLRSLSSQTGVSVGFAGSLPNIRTKAVHGARSAAEALSQMLAGSGYRAIATGQSSFRLERVPKAERLEPPSPRDTNMEAAHIVVTALKRRASLFSLPATIAIIKPDDLQSASGIGGSDTLDRELPSLSTSDVGAGRNRLFLRGIGDGPLGGYNQSSVAILMDEARLTYDAPDPDWALVDIDRVEVLEGPQGPLYGTGAIGGIVKIVTRQPDLVETSLSANAGVAITRDGDLTNSQSLVLNVPLADGKSAMRAVTYRVDRAGWIDNVGGKGDGNRERLAGGRLNFKFAPSRWTVDIGGAVQSRGAGDSQYVDGDLGPLKRPGRLREAGDLDATLAMFTVSGPVAGLELTSVTSLSKQEAVAAYDATPLAGLLGTSGVTKVTDDRRYTVFDQEVRLRNPAARSFDWIAGVSLIKASTDSKVSAEDASTKVDRLSFSRSVMETALFGEGTYKINSRLAIGAGGRLFSSRIEDEGRYGGDDTLEGKTIVRGSASAAVNWQAAPGTAIFARASTAYRPGGINVQPEATQQKYEADELASIELGTHVTVDGILAISTTAFATQWKHVQADELLGDGLVATRNAGDALNYGIEGKLSWLPTASTTVNFGFLLQSSRLQDETPGAEVDDKRLPVVPQTAARLKIAKEFMFAGWNGRAAVGVDYEGATHLSFDPTLDRRTRGHATFDASLLLSNGLWSIGLVADNLGNSTADSFAFGNPYRIRDDAQRTPERPRTIGINIGRTF